VSKLKAFANSSPGLRFGNLGNSSHFSKAQLRRSCVGVCYRKIAQPFQGANSPRAFKPGFKANLAGISQRFQRYSTFDAPRNFDFCATHQVLLEELPRPIASTGLDRAALDSARRKPRSSTWLRPWCGSGPKNSKAKPDQGRAERNPLLSRAEPRSHPAAKPFLQAHDFEATHCSNK